MDASARSLSARQGLADGFAGFRKWLRTHRHTVAMAGLLSFAAPVIFFTGAVSVMRAPTAAQVAALALWWLLHAMALWCLMLVSGHVCRGLEPASGRGKALAIALLYSGVAAAFVTLSTAGRAGILIEQGVVTRVTTVHLYTFALSLTSVLLYYAYLWRSRIHETAVARLAGAQAAQHEIERRMLQTRLQAVQARVDPLLLFEMLEAVRRWYERDATRAECLLDELIAFLRAALPRLKAESSSVPREAELARACVRLRALAGADDFSLAVTVAPDVVHARCPPGVLLPLLDDVLRTAAGPCSLAATRAGDCSCLALTLPARPSAGALERVQALLADVYGTRAELVATNEVAADGTTASPCVIVRVPYALA